AHPAGHHQQLVRDLPHLPPAADGRGRAGRTIGRWWAGPAVDVGDPRLCAADAGATGSRGVRSAYQLRPTHDRTGIRRHLDPGPPDPDAEHDDPVWSDHHLRGRVAGSPEPSYAPPGRAPPHAVGRAAHEHPRPARDSLVDRIRLPTIDAARPLGAAAYGTLQPLSTPSMPTVPGMGARGFTSPALDRGGYKNAADRFLSKYSQDFATGYEDDFGIGFGNEGVGSPFTNVGAIAGGALANAQGAINAAAARHGIPANLLAAIIARASTGNWDRDGNRYVYLPERGYNILPYVGMTDPAVKRVGMDPRSLVGNMEGQIEAAARLIKAISQEEAAGYGWQGVANVYYSGDPTGRTTPSDSWQHGSTQQYGNDILRFWEMLEPGGPSKTSASNRSGSSAFGSL